MLQELWAAIREKHGRAPKPPGFQAAIPKDDEPISVVDVHGPPTHSLEPLSGFTCIISYSDSKGRGSERRITCVRLEQNGPARYIRAFCHERGAVRQFKVERVSAIADVHTGELISEDAEAYFTQFLVDHHQQSQIGWGLSVMQRADLLAGLNVLVFMARCDKDWHPLERDEIERFITAYWLRHEIAAELPLDDILNHVARLSPDPEVFYVSLTRCAERPALVPVLRRSLQSVIDADGHVHENEFYWGRAVDDFFRSLAA